MIVTIGFDEEKPYDKTDGTNLPMFSRTGRGTTNQYMVFQQKEQGDRLENVSELSQEDNEGADTDIINKQDQPTENAYKKNIKNTID